MGFGQWGANVPEEKRFLAFPGCSECWDCSGWKSSRTVNVPVGGVATSPLFSYLSRLTPYHFVFALPDVRGIINLFSVVTLAFTIGHSFFPSKKQGSTFALQGRKTYACQGREKPRKPSGRKNVKREKDDQWYTCHVASLQQRKKAAV